MLFTSFIKDSYSPFLLQCKVDSDHMSLVTAWDRGGLWKVGTIFLECEKKPKSVLKCLDLVLKMQNNSIAVSNLLCYDNEPRVNKNISFKLLGNMVTLFITVRSFPYAEEKHKVKSNKSKSWWRIHPKQRYGLLNASSKPVAVSGNDFKHIPEWLFL